jgi:hypothetical protein
VENGYAYIADGYGGVEVVDVFDPMNPSVVGYIDLIDGSTGIKVDGNYAYVSEYILGGLQMLDISHPATPTIAGWYQPSGVFALGVESFNGFAYISDGLGGIQIYRNLLVTPVSVEPNQTIVNKFNLEQNYPNPFNPSTKIKYEVVDKSFVTIKVYDVIGREVATLVNGEQSTGTYQVEFNASILPSGVYFYQLKTGNYLETKKMMLLK